MTKTDSAYMIRKCVSIIRNSETEPTTILPNKRKAADYAHEIIVERILCNVEQQNKKTKKHTKKINADSNPT